MKKVPAVTTILPALAMLLLASGTAGAQALRVVNAASQLAGGPFAPNTIITIYGNNLTLGTASAPTALNPPTSLGGVSVTIGAIPAALFFVSPTQINAVIAQSTPLGNQTLVVQSPSGSTSTVVAIDRVAAPGLFSLYGSGARDGAILNAITYLLGAFSTTTANRPTYLALFLTGLDRTQAPVVTIAGVAVPVLYYGPSPCCLGLDQINVQLTEGLAGAGRVPVLVRSGAFVSNVVEVVILPRATEGTGLENETRNRELSALAHVPGTSTALLADENDDVVRVIDVRNRRVTDVIALPDDSEPTAIGVRPDGKLAVVAERKKGWAALVDLVGLRVVKQVPVGAGPSAVAVTATLALVSNTDENTVSVVDLTTHALVKTIPVGTHPRGIAINTATNQAFVVNRLSGTVSVIDLGLLAVSRTVNLGAAARPEAIQLLGGSNLAAITDLGGADGDVLILNLATGALSTLNVDPARIGGLGAIAFAGNRLFVANQAAGTLLAVTISIATGGAAGPSSVIRVPVGGRTLAVDPVDQVLLVGSEGTGRIVLVSLSNEQIIGEINGLKRDDESDDDEEQRSDRGRTANAPAISSVSPSSSARTASFTLSLAGRNLAGATDIWFVNPDSIPGKGKGRGRGNSGGNPNGPFGSRDAAFSVSNVRTGSNGQVTATVTVSNATPGPRIVRVATPNGDSTFVQSDGNTFTIRP